MAPEMSRLRPTTTMNTPPNTPTESSEPVATSTIHEMGALTNMLSMKVGPSQSPGEVAHPAHPGQDAPASSQKEESSSPKTYLNQIKLHFVDQPDVYNMFLHVLGDYKSQAIDELGLINRVSLLFAGHPELLREFNTYMPRRNQTACRSSNVPNTICAASYPVTTNLSTPIQTAQDSGTNGVAPEQPDASQAKAAAAQNAESFDISAIIGPCSTSLLIPQRLAILTQPPKLTRPEIELYPPIVVRLLHPEDMSNVWAVVTLLSGDTDVTHQLRGDIISSPIGEYFCFSGLTIHEQGIYRLRISLYQMDFAQVGYVDSNDIIIATRPDTIALRQSIGDVTTARNTQWAAQPLLFQTVDANTCIDDHTGYFPNLKIHAGSSVIIMGQIQYLKYMVLIPVSDFLLETASLDHGLYNFGDRLFQDQNGVWFDDGEIERTEGLDELIWHGEDGEMYRKRTAGVFNDLFVGLERRAAIVSNGVMCIAHNVLINTSE